MIGMGVARATWLILVLGLGCGGTPQGRELGGSTGGSGESDADAGGTDGADESSTGAASEDSTQGAEDGGDESGDSSTGADVCGLDECSIDGVCIDAGTPSPEAECFACVPEIDPTTWVEDPDNPCDTSYWVDVDREIATTPYGHRTAISCHNCYAPTLEGTLAELHAAQADGADLLELDLTDEGGQVIVEHDDGGGADGPLLVDVLMDPALQAGDQILNIELKEMAPTEAFVGAVLDALVASGCVGPGRPVMLRAFVHDARLQNLLIAQTLLATPAYAELAPHVRLHALLQASDGASTATLIARVDENAARGFQAIEFAIATPNLLTGIHHAESLGLGTSVWTVPALLGEVHIAALRDEVDSITTDHPVASARAHIEADNGRFYLDATLQDARATAIDWVTTDSDAVTTADLAAPGRPLVVAGVPGDVLLGTALEFVAAEERSLPIADIGADTGGGVLVAALVRLDALSLADGDTMSVLGKANAGEYALELHNPPGTGGTVLRFGVHVGSGYSYASVPTSALDSERAHWVVGAYDGSGAVNLLVDHSAANTTSSSAEGAITANDVLMQLGADPQDPDAPRFFLEGAIQTALVQAWP
jgi:glycerophosphoryl diester phosphodiesterase